MLTPAPDAAETRRLVHKALRALLVERGLDCSDPQDEDRLGATLGLRSLDLAHLIFDLELTFARNPFEEGVPITSIRTVGDVVAAFTPATGPRSDPIDDELMRSQQAAARRRERRGLT